LSLSLNNRSAQPQVSVVMTTYNGERFLAQQIDSVLRQTFADFELIIADDGSTDATVALLKQYASKDRRIRLMLNTENMGIHRNLEQALRDTRGGFVAISDQDDIWSLGKLECLMEKIGGCSAAYSDSFLIDEAGASLGATLLQRIEVTRPAIGGQAVAILRRNCVSGHTMLFRRDLLELALPFDDRLMFDQQLGFFAALDRGLEYVDQPQVWHRIHGMNQTNKGFFARPQGHVKDVHERRMSRIDRYRKRRSEFAEKLQYCSVGIDHLQDQNTRYPRVKKLVRKMINISIRLQKFEETWFDIPLFWLLVSMRKQIFYADEKNVIRRCAKYSKGAKYYRNE